VSAEVEVHIAALADVDRKMWSGKSAFCFPYIEILAVIRDGLERSVGWFMFSGEPYDKPALTVNCYGVVLESRFLSLHGKRTS